MKLPQYDLGIWFGGTKTQIMRVQMYSGSFAVLFSMVAAWPPLLVRFPWLHFWMLPLGVIIAITLIGVLDYVFMIRSEYSFQAHQVWHANNPTTDFLKAIRDNQDRLDKNMALIMEHMGIKPVVEPDRRPYPFKKVSDSIPMMPVMDEQERLEKLRRER